MDRVNGDIVLQVNDPTKTAGNLIEWNVDMRVTVSNVKNSMTFQRSRTVVLFLTAIVFAVLLSNLKEEVRALQIQVQSVNVNLLLLMSKYDRLNRSLNRAWIERSERRQRSRQLYDVKGSLERALSLFKAIENFEGIRNATIGGNPPATYNSGIQYFKPVENLQNEYSWHDKDEEKDDDKFSKPLINVEGNKDGILNDTVTRFERATENRNTTEKFAEQRSGKIGYDGDENDEYFDEEDLGTWRESRGGRTRRDEGRGKKRGKNRRRPKRSHRRLGPLVATFVGAIPEQHVTDTVYIGPWVKSTKNNTQYSLNKFHLVEDKKSIEVTATGLYMISAQIFYFGEPTNYSYWILLSSEGKSTTRKLVKCSTASSTLATEVSCYTSVITPLQRGDRVHIQQQERDRLINMREGHSYIQLVLLSNSIGKRRLQ